MFVIVLVNISPFEEKKWYILFGDKVHFFGKL